MWKPLLLIQELEKTERKDTKNSSVYVVGCSVGSVFMCEFVYRALFLLIILAFNVLLYMLLYCFGLLPGNPCIMQFLVCFSIFSATFCVLFFDQYLALIPSVFTCVSISNQEVVEGVEIITITVQNRGKNAVDVSVENVVGANVACSAELYDRLDGGVRTNYCYCLADVVSVIFPNCLACGIP